MSIEVLDSKNLKVGETHRLCDLPAGIVFAWGKSLYKTIVHPEYNITEHNRIIETFAMAEKKISFLPGRCEVKILKIF